MKEKYQFDLRSIVCALLVGAGPGDLTRHSAWVAGIMATLYLACVIVVGVEMVRYWWTRSE